ncbi:MAG: outer membrane beta-barrel protein [Marinobacter sp.]
MVFGFTRIELEAQSTLGTTTEDESDFSYGAGVNVELSPEVAGNLEYMRYYDKNGATVDGLGLGVTFSF